MNKLELLTPKEIAEIIKVDSSNIQRTYYRKPENEGKGLAVEMGCYLILNDVSKKQLKFMVEFMKSHKDYIRDNI